jgi:hypothetical protein
MLEAATKAGHEGTKSLMLEAATKAGHEGTKSLMLEAEASIDTTTECDDTMLRKATDIALSAKEDKEVERLREENSRLRNETAALTANEDEIRRLSEEISRSDTATLSENEDETRRLTEENGRLR